MANKNHSNDKNASQRETIKKLNKDQNNKTSNEASIFDIEDNNLENESFTKTDVNNQEVANSEEDILNEIETALKEGAYRADETKKEQENTEPEEVALVNHSQLDKPSTQPTEKAGKKKDKNKKAKKNYEKTTFSHKMRVLATLLVLGIFTGSGLGVWYFNVNLKSQVDYGSMKAADYIKPISTVLDSNFGIANSNQYKTWFEHVGNKTPDNLSAVDNVLLAVHNATLADSFLFTGNGKAISLGVTQTVYSQRRHIDNIYTFESISKGTISVANFDYYVNGSRNIDIYTGQNISQRNADWNYNKTITADEYENMTGSLPSGITPYIISEKTIQSSEMTKDDNGNYVITFVLDPVTSVINYYKEVRRTGGLEADPEFYDVKYIATIDSKWNLITTEVFESYKAVKFGMGVKCNGTIKIDYEFNCDVTLPPLKGK